MSASHQTAAAENTPPPSGVLAAGPWDCLPAPQTTYQASCPKTQNGQTDRWTHRWWGGGLQSELRGEGTKWPEAESQEHESKEPRWTGMAGAQSLRGAGLPPPSAAWGREAREGSPPSYCVQRVPSHRWLGPEDTPCGHHGADTAVQFLLGQTFLEIQHILQL